MENQKTKIFGILITLVFLFAGFIYWLGQTPKDNSIPPVQVNLASMPKTPSPEPVTTSETETLAPNGKDTLIVRERKTSEGINKTFFIKNEDGETYEIFSKTADSGTAITVPFNTFSPDNKYLFLIDNTGPEEKHFVLHTSQDDLDKNLEPVYFTNLFKERFPDLSVENPTGWGGMTLILINATNDNGAGLSFWYDVTLDKFTQLANRF